MTRCPVCGDALAGIVTSDVEEVLACATLVCAVPCGCPVTLQQLAGSSPDDVRREHERLAQLLHDHAPAIARAVSTPDDAVRVVAMLLQVSAW